MIKNSVNGELDVKACLRYSSFMAKAVFSIFPLQTNNFFLMSIKMYNKIDAV